MWFSYFITWEQRKLGELGKAQSGIGFPDKEQGGKKGIPFFKVSDMNNLGNELEMHIANNYVSLEQIKKNGWSPIEETSVIFAKVGAAIMLNRKRLVRFPFLLDNNTMAYKFNDAWEIDFGRTLFERIDLTSLVQVGALPSYNAGDVENMEVAIPQKAEQAKLGALFTSLDNLITLHQRKQNWQDLLFSRKKLPSILAIAWEQRKFESLAETRRGLTYNPSNISPHGIRVLRSSNINEDIFVLSDDDVFVCPDAVKIECAKPNDILITAANGSTRLVGKHAIIVGIRENEAVHGGFMLVASSSMPFFLNAAMSAPWYLKFINLFVAGGNGAIGNLNKNDLDNQLLFVPKNAEQEQIGEFFRNFDNLITLHQCNGILIHNEYDSSSLFNLEYKMAIAWEQRKLGSMVYRINEMSDIDGLPRVEYEDIEAGQGTLNKDLKEKVSTKKGIVFQYGDILYGKLRPYLKNWLFAWFSGIAVGDFWVLRSNLVSHSFIYRLVQTPAFDYIANQSTGSKMPRADWNLVSNSEFALPLSSEEQEAIGQIFLKLDNLITLHQCKDEANFNPKSPLIFQLEDECNVFAWEQRKLGEEVDITMGQSPDGSTYRETPAEYILVQGNADLKDGWVFPRVWTTQKTKTAEAGDLIMSVRAPAGAMGKTAYNVVLGRGVAAIKGNEFIFQTLVKMDLDGYWKKLAAGSTFESINSDTVSNAVMSMPQQVEEQSKLGDLFESIDNLITLHQRGENIYNRRQTW